MSLPRANRAPWKAALAGALVAVELCCINGGIAKAAPPPRICSGCNFAGMPLGGADFTNVIYVGSNFAGSDLRKASFRDAKLVAANFLNANLRGAALDGIECTACNFLGAKLDGTTFSSVRMTSVNFKGFSSAVADTDLRALLAGCISCDFTESRLAGRDLSNLAIVAVDFSGADLRGTKFDGSALCWYGVNGAKRETSCDSLKNADVEAASFRNVQLCDEPVERLGCAPVDTDALRKYTGSPLSGAIFSP